MSTKSNFKKLIGPSSLPGVVKKKKKKAKKRKKIFLTW